MVVVVMVEEKRRRKVEKEASRRVREGRKRHEGVEVDVR